MVIDFTKKITCLQKLSKKKKASDESLVTCQLKLKTLNL